MERLLEICCSSLDACLEAKRGGANRIELCGSMAAGGLTPSLGLFRLVKEKCGIPIAVMIRPRGSGFCYDEHDVEVMYQDAEIFLKEGASAIVFGFLNADRTIDEKHVAQFVALAHQYGKEAVFHRAIDDCEDLLKEIGTLHRLGVDRVLTAGGAKTAWEQLDVLKKIVEAYATKMQVIICGGIRANNVAAILKETNVKQIHSACRVMIQDRTQPKSDTLGYDNAYDSVDGDGVNDMVKAMAECEG